MLVIRLTWVPHIKYILRNALKAIYILRVIAEVSWGADLSTLELVYRNLVRACLEWSVGGGQTEKKDK